MRKEAALLKAKAIASMRQMVATFNGIDDETDNGLTSHPADIPHAPAAA